MDELGSCFVPGYSEIKAPKEYCENIVKIGGEAMLAKELVAEVFWFITNGRCVDMIENPFTEKCCEWHVRYKWFRERAKKLGINV